MFTLRTTYAHLLNHDLLYFSDIPDLVKNCSVQINNGDISIRWIPPTNEDNQFLKVVLQYSAVSNRYDDRNTIEFKYPQSSYTLTDVPKNTIVRFKLRALNDCGKAGPVTELIANTKKESALVSFQSEHV